MTNWFLFLLNNQNEGWCHGRKIQVICSSIPSFTEHKLCSSPWSGLWGFKFEQVLKHRDLNRQACKNFIECSVLLENYTYCHESPEREILFLLRGTQERSARRWCLGGSWRMCRNLLRKRRDIVSWRGPRPHNSIIIGFLERNNVQGPDSSSESDRKPAQQRFGL